MKSTRQVQANVRHSLLASGAGMYKPCPLALFFFFLFFFFFQRCCSPHLADVRQCGPPGPLSQTAARTENDDSDSSYFGWTLARCAPKWKRCQEKIFILNFHHRVSSVSLCCISAEREIILAPVPDLCAGREEVWLSAFLL